MGPVARLDRHVFGQGAVAVPVREAEDPLSHRQSGRAIAKCGDHTGQLDGVPVVVVSGKSDASEIGTRIGARRVFKKPFVVDELVNEVSRVLN